MKASFANRFPMAHTFSIVARDPQTGEMGVAVQSHWFSVGSIVTWGEAGVGVVATQAMVEASYGPLGLELMRAGRSPQSTLNALMAADEHADIRQVAMVDAQGRVAAHTGQRTIQDAGHETGEQFSVQANMMANPNIWPAMANAYRTSKGDLANRLVTALEAGQAAGGDVRGQQSAALLIVAPQATGRSWVDRRIELRIEDHPQPVVELRRLLGVHTAYQLMNQGDAFLGDERIEDALAAYREASSLAPEILEMPFWHAVTLLDLGRVEDAVRIFRDVFSREPNWAVLLQRLPAAGLLSATPEMLNKVLAVTKA